MLSFYSIAFTVNPIMRHETQAWCGVTSREASRQQKWEEVLLMLYYIDKNWYHFIKEYLEKFSKFAFQDVACPVGWNFCLKQKCADVFVMKT